jgi:hypothetical protein
MSFDKEEYLEIFSQHFKEFINDVARIFPEDEKIQSVKCAFIIAININSKKCINNWKKFVVDKFRNEIENNDYNFFIENDWSSSIVHEEKDSIINKINELREPLRMLSTTNKTKALRYVENLVKLCDLYFS